MSREIFVLMIDINIDLGNTERQGGRSTVQNIGTSHRTERIRAPDDPFSWGHSSSKVGSGLASGRVYRE